MKPSNNNSINSPEKWQENTLSHSVDFDLGAIDDSPLFEGEFGEVLRDAVQNFCRRKLIQIFFLFDSMTDEERLVFKRYTIENKSFREIGREIGRDHKTVQARYYDTILKIKNSPVVNVTFNRKGRNH